VNAFEKANDEAFFFAFMCLFNRIHTQLQPQKKTEKRKKNPSIGHTHIDTNLKKEENIVRKPCMTK
jgi:hypothetical protein